MVRFISSVHFNHLNHFIYNIYIRRFQITLNQSWTLISLCDISISCNIISIVKTRAHFIQITLIIKSYDFKTINLISVFIRNHAVWANSKSCVSHINITIFTKNRISIFSFKIAFFSNHKITITSVTFPIWSRNRKKSLTRKGHISKSASFLKRALFKNSVKLVSFNTKAKLTNNRCYIIRAQFISNNAIIIHATKQQFRKTLTNCHIFFVTSSIHICKIVRNRI